MDSPGVVVREFFERMQARDWDGAGLLLSPTLRIEFTETGERFTGPNFLAMNRAYHTVVAGQIAEGVEHWVTERSASAPAWRDRFSD